MFTHKPCEFSTKTNKKLKRQNKNYFIKTIWNQPVLVFSVVVFSTSLLTYDFILFNYIFSFEKVSPIKLKHAVTKQKEQKLHKLISKTQLILV